MSSGSGSGSGATAAPDTRKPTTFSVLQDVPLRHLPNNGKFVVQRQRGGHVPDDAVQFYLAWSWDAPNGGGRAWKGGGSVQAGQVQDVIDALSTAVEKAESSGGAIAGSPEGEKRPPTYAVLSDVPLKHLPNGARFVVQRQRGGQVPDDAVQFYLAWTSIKIGGGTSWTGGGSIQAGQVPEIIDALASACESETGRRPSCGGAPDGGGGKVGQTGTFADLFAGDDGDDEVCEDAAAASAATSDSAGQGGCTTFADLLDEDEVEDGGKDMNDGGGG